MDNGSQKNAMIEKFG